jgi:hypothetical protein
MHHHGEHHRDGLSESTGDADLIVRIQENIVTVCAQAYHIQVPVSCIVSLLLTGHLKKFTFCGT